ITRSLSTTAKSDVVTVSSERLFSSVAKNVTRTSETVIRYVGVSEPSFLPWAAAGQVAVQVETQAKANKARSTARDCQCANIAARCSLLISPIGERWNTPQLPWLPLQVTRRLVKPPECPTLDLG